MRRWLRASATAVAEVADRPGLWLPGALAWSVTEGWIALAAGVIRPPGASELTFFGARMATSGSWPWNLVALLVAAALVLAAAFALAALAETSLVRGRRPALAAAPSAFLVGLACALPAVVAMFAVAVALPGIAQAEFNAPDSDPGPLLRTVLRLLPLLVAVLVAAAAGGAIHAAAVRAAVAGRTAGEALRAAPRMLALPGASAAVHALVLGAVRIGFLLVAAILLRVLWDPIGVRLAGEGFGVAAVLLLLGFVAIWLCLVLAGGALHAWGSVTWTRLLSATEGAGRQQQMERRLGP